MVSKDEFVAKWNSVSTKMKMVLATNRSQIFADEYKFVDDSKVNLLRNGMKVAVVSFLSIAEVDSFESI